MPAFEPQFAPPVEVAALRAVSFDATHSNLLPSDEALVQLGSAIMNELLDTVLGSGLEPYLAVICETLIGGLHTGVTRVEREADRARDALACRLREFDGSEVADSELEEARLQTEGADSAVGCLERLRDSAAEAYGCATGEVWSPWRGSLRPNRTTSAQIDAQAALRAMRARRQAEADPGGVVVAFRAAPRSDAPQDASRIFDALNWARSEWPDMSLALTGAPGGERIAKRWAQQKGVRLVLARPDFDRHGRAAPFRANDDLMALEPVCVLVLARSLAETDAAAFGPALSLAQLAREQGVKCLRITARPPG
jgi:hypothetical protein